MRRLKFGPIFPWIYRSSGTGQISGPSRLDPPLREFVYLDEVSLSSLLASQKGEQTENIVSEAAQDLIAEVSGTMKAGSPVGPSAEIGSRFQTSNSSALQTTRKANAQSLFRELYSMQGLRKFETGSVRDGVSSLEDLFDGVSSSECYRASDLSRGDLVEFKVRLSASWIFQMSTMVSEFAEIFDQSPHMFINNVKISDLFEAKDAQKVLNKLLGDLIPIEGTATEYGVISKNGMEYVVLKDALPDNAPETQPLQIVGVTDHLAYWKDIRRLLFADHEFTMLCRLSRPGLQNKWNPIKVADIFAQFAPDIAQQIETASKTALSKANQPDEDAVVRPSEMTRALHHYASLLLESSPETESAFEVITAQIEGQIFQDGSAAGQRAAFGEVRKWVEEAVDCKFDAEEDLQIRNRVRDDLGLSVFNIDASPIVEQISHQPVTDEPSSLRLLEVEVVAIYW